MEMNSVGISLKDNEFGDFPLREGNVLEWRNMLKNKRNWIILAVLLFVVGGGGYAYYANAATAAEAADAEPPIQTSVVRRGELVISATGAGTVIAASEVDLSFQVNGVLAELLVQVGDTVNAGEVLARLDDTDAEEALVNTQLQLKQVAMTVDPAATTTGTTINAISIEQARINLTSAQDTLDELLEWVPDEEEIAQAEASLEAAQASYNAALGQEAASSNNISVSRISVDQAERDLADAQAAYDTAWDSGRDWELNDPRQADALEAERDRTEASLLRAQESLQVAQLNYNSTAVSVNRSSSAGAMSNLLSAQVALETAKNGPSEDEIQAAETAVLQAELAWQQAELNLEADKLSLEQAQLNLESAQRALADVELLAPMDGTVTAINYHVGEQVSGTIITLANLNPPTLEVYVDETDMSMVGMDFEVDVNFDALPNDLFTGHVVRVDPQLSDVNGVTAVRAIVQLDTESFAKPQTLPIGLNATVDVIGGRAENSLLAPVEALREISPGEFAVFVMEGDEPQLRFVEVGLMDFTFAEILSGLEAGEIVTTGIVETQ